MINPQNIISSKMSYRGTTFYEEGAIKQDYCASTADNFYAHEESLREYELLMRENQWLKNELDKKYACLRTHQDAGYEHDSSKDHQFSAQDDIVLHQIIKRNKYLEEKNFELKQQHLRQGQEIRKIEQSDKWRDKFRCCPQKCYHRKYIQLLRVKSPLF